MTRKNVTLLLPKQDNHGADITDLHPNILNAVLDITGGYSLSHIQGAWKDDQGQLYFDNNLKVETLVSDAFQVNRLRQLAEQAAIDLSQHCIYMSINDVDVEFVEPYTPAQREVA